MLIDGAAVVTLRPETETVPLTTAETDKPGTTLTTPVPEIETSAPGLNHTGKPETETLVCVVTGTMLRTLIVPDTKAEPVKLTTVVPAPAVTVPVITTGKAVVDWPP